MRAHRFVLLKPIVLLAVLPLERSLCRQACDSMPGAHSIQAGTMRRCLLQTPTAAARVAAAAALAAATVAALVASPPQLSGSGLSAMPSLAACRAAPVGVQLPLSAGMEPPLHRQLSWPHGLAAGACPAAIFTRSAMCRCFLLCAGMAHHFTSAAELVGLLVAPFRPVPPPPLAVANRSVAGASLQR